VNANQEEIINQDIQSNNIGLVNNLDQNAEYNNRYDDMNNHNHNHINTDNLRSFNSESNYMNGSQTQTHFKNKYKNLFDNYFSSNNFDDNTDCITSYI
jgi:hypothetical protein